MCNHCCCTHAAPRSVFMTAKQWMARGFIICRGERSVGRNLLGTPLFARSQVRYL